MNASQRIIVNTIAQYTKAIINILLSLFSTRLVIDALNVRDYGIYVLVGGIVGILGYFTNAMVVTTQRYLSYCYGKNDYEEAKRVFTNSAFIHLLVCLLFLIVLLTFKDMILFNCLKIDDTRVWAAQNVYVCAGMMMIFSVLTTPFKAVLIAHENIVFTSLVDILDAVLKLVLAISLFYVSYDKLVYYAFFLSLIFFVNLLIYGIFATSRFKECHSCFYFSYVDKSYLVKLVGFAGWTSFSLFSGMCQMQGIAVIINHFMGTLVNASFGLAMQVNGAVRFVSVSILNAMNPQIMKAEGEGNRRQMVELASKESRFSSAMMMIVAIPIIVEMDSILSFWLKNVPEYTALFCRSIMIAFIVDQITMGLHVANQAIGNLKVFTLLTTVPKILMLPILWLILDQRNEVVWMMTIYVGIELLVAIVRIPFMHFSAHIDGIEYAKKTIIPLCPLLLVIGITSFALHYIDLFPYDFVVKLFIAAAVGVLTLWFFTMTAGERKLAKKVLKKG